MSRRLKISPRKIPPLSPERKREVSPKASPRRVSPEAAPQAAPKIILRAAPEASPKASPKKAPTKIIARAAPKKVSLKLPSGRVSPRISPRVSSPAKINQQQDQQLLPTSFAELFSAVRPAISKNSIDEVLLCTIFEYLGIVDYSDLAQLVEQLPQFKREIYHCVRSLRITQNDVSALRRQHALKIGRIKFGEEGADNYELINEFTQQLPNLRGVIIPYEYAEESEEVQEVYRFPRRSLVTGLIFEDFEGEITARAIRTLTGDYPNLQYLEGAFSVENPQTYTLLEPYLDEHTEVNFFLPLTDANILLVQRFIDKFPRNNFMVAEPEGLQLIVKNGVVSVDEEPVDLPAVVRLLSRLRNIGAVQLNTVGFPVARDETEKEALFTRFMRNNPTIQVLDIFVTEGDRGNGTGLALIEGQIPLPPVRVVRVVDYQEYKEQESEVEMDKLQKLKFRGPGLQTVEVLIAAFPTVGQLLAALQLFPRLREISVEPYDPMYPRKLDKQLGDTLQKWNREHKTKVVGERESVLTAKYIRKTIRSED